MPGREIVETVYQIVGCWHFTIYRRWFALWALNGKAIDNLPREIGHGWLLTIHHGLISLISHCRSPFLLPIEYNRSFFLFPGRISFRSFAFLGY